VNHKQWSTGLMSALMPCTGGVILLIHSANGLGIDNRGLLSWIFAAYTLAGLFNLLLAWRYKLPIAGAHSVTAIAFLSTVSVQLSLPQIIGSFIMAGALVALLGISGIFQIIFKHIPRPVIDAMLAGIIAHYIIELVPAFKSNPLVGLLAVCGFFIIPKLFKALPSIVGVISLGLIGLLLTYTFPTIEQLSFQLPQLTMPQFGWQGFISLALPISILVLSNDVAVALASLGKQNYPMPTNRIITYSGLASMLGGFFNGHTINIGGMMTTMCSSDAAGVKEQRYRAAMLSSIICILFGIFAWLIVPYVTILPSYFIAIIIGYSLLGIFMNSMHAAFGNSQYRFSVLFAFIISAAGITMLGISAALWSLVIGTITAKLLKEHTLSRSGESREENEA
jgi:benzoate membrane transport protein